jgi:outer membrane lipoprotein-sorting protein
MCLTRNSIVATFVLLFGAPMTAYADPSAAEIVQRADTMQWGAKTLQGEFEMTLITPTWSRSMVLKIWADRPNKSFVRIVSPAKDAGLGSLSISPEMWNYVPSIERTIKIPPSLMLQPWFGSDFTNDDVMKQGNIVTYYTYRLLGEKTVDGNVVYEIELLPKPDAAVAWGKIIFLVRKSDFLPMGEDYYDERGKLVRQLIYSDIRAINGQVRPTRLEMRSTENPGRRTVLQIKSLAVDQAIDPSIFTLQNLIRKN